MKNRKRVMSAFVITAVSLASASVVAFPQSSEWHQSASGARPGAGDIYANGSRQDWGITCAQCHVNDKKQQGHIDVAVTPQPAWQKVGGVDAYKPGQIYQMTVMMSKSGTNVPGDNLGAPGNNNNINGFTLTIEDQNGAPQGVLRSDAVPNMCPPSAPMPDAFVPNFTTYTYGTCNSIVSLRQIQVLTQWTFTWQAPAAGKQDLTIYYGAVDGDGGKTLYGDDVKIGTIKLKEGT